MSAPNIDYRSIIENSIAAIGIHTLVLDNSGKPIDYVFDYVNPEFERITGLKATKVVGKRVLDVLPGTEMVWIARYGEVALTGVPTKFESFSADLGKYYQVEAFRHKPLGFTATFIDVTERVLEHNRADHERTKYQSFFDLGSPKLVIDKQTSEILAANPLAEKFYGYTSEQLKSMKITEINVLSEPQTREEIDACHPSVELTRGRHAE